MGAAGRGKAIGLKGVARLSGCRGIGSASAGWASLLQDSLDNAPAGHSTPAPKPSTHLGTKALLGGAAGGHLHVAIIIVGEGEHVLGRERQKGVRERRGKGQRAIKRCGMHLLCQGLDQRPIARQALVNLSTQLQMQPQPSCSQPALKHLPPPAGPCPRCPVRCQRRASSGSGAQEHRSRLLNGGRGGPRRQAAEEGVSLAWRAAGQDGWWARVGKVGGGWAAGGQRRGGPLCMQGAGEAGCFSLVFGGNWAAAAASPAAGTAWVGADSSGAEAGHAQSRADAGRAYLPPASAPGAPIPPWRLSAS